MEMPVPYRGADNYIFISYAHKDAHLVWPVVQQLRNDGYRVWYDEGIDPGTEWDETIAAHVDGCAFFIAFLSRNYLASENCKDELSFARDLGKRQLLVYLQPVRLPQGLALRVGRAQSVRAWPGSSFYRRLYAVEGLREFTDQAGVPSRRSSRWPVVALGIAAVATVVAAVLLLNPKPEVPELPAQTTAAAIPETTLPAAQPQELILQNAVLTNANGLTVSVGDLYTTERGLVMTLDAVNKTGRETGLLFQNFYVNGASCYPELENSRSTEEKFTITLTWPFYTLEEAGISVQEATDVRYVDFYFEPLVVDSPDMQITVFPYGEAHAGDMAYQLSEDAQLLLDDDQVSLYVMDVFPDCGGTVTYLGINKTDAPIEIGIQTLLNDVTALNTGLHLMPNRWCMSANRAYEWEESGAFGVEKVAGTITVVQAEQRREVPLTYYPRGNTDYVYTPWQATGEEPVLADEWDFRARLLRAEPVNEEKLRIQLYVEHRMDDYHFLDAAFFQEEEEWTYAYSLRNFAPQTEAFVVFELPREELDPDGVLRFTLRLSTHQYETVYEFPVELEIQEVP